MTIRVSTQEMQNQIDRIATTVSRLEAILSNIQRITRTLASVAWISPAASAMLAKADLKIRAFERAIQAWRSMSTMLTNALNLIRQAETQAHGNTAAVRANAFRS